MPYAAFDHMPFESVQTCVNQRAPWPFAVMVW